MGETVLLIGASRNETRYSHKAMTLLLENGHTVIPVNPNERDILGVPTVAAIEDVDARVTTASVYVRPELLQKSLDALIALSPKRVILNPGTEDDDITSRLRSAGIEVIHACTIVMLKTEQF